MERVRLDKWLWAARFFRTRGKAKAAITGGKVHCDGQRAKPARDVTVGTQLRIRRGEEEFTVDVLALSEIRRSASEAQALYAETDTSKEAREIAAAQRTAARNAIQFPGQRPDRRDRRTLGRLKRGEDE